MGANSPQGRQDRAFTGIAQSFGPPVAGKSQSIAFDGTDKTITLEGPAVYRLVAVTNACFIAVGAVATTAANAEYLQPNWDRWLQVPPGGAVLHATQVTAAGTMYASKCDDVG